MNDYFFSFEIRNSFNKTRFCRSRSARVFVGRIPYDCREKDLDRFFRNYGRLNDIIIKNGYGFVVSFCIKEFFLPIFKTKLRLIPILEPRCSNLADFHWVQSHYSWLLPLDLWHFILAIKVPILVSYFFFLSSYSYFSK